MIVHRVGDGRSEAEPRSRRARGGEPASSDDRNRVATGTNPVGTPTVRPDDGGACPGVMTATLPRTGRPIPRSMTSGRSKTASGVVGDPRSYLSESEAPTVRTGVPR